MVDLQKEKAEILAWIETLEDSDTLSFLKQINEAHGTQQNWWHTLSDAERKGIEQGLKDIEEGRTHSHESVRSRYAKYL